MNTLELSDAIKRVEDANADTEVRVTRRIEIGSAIQQGDVYIHRVSDDHPHGEQIGKGSVQVALGTGNGSRHMAEGDVMVFAGHELPDGVNAPMNVESREICGPVIKASSAWNLTHPEHPHHSLPAGVYQVTYQYDPQTMRRVQD